MRIFPRRVLTLLVGGRNFRKMLILPKQGSSSRCKVLRRQREAGPRSPKVLQEAEKMHPKRVSAKLLEIFSRSNFGVKKRGFQFSIEEFPHCGNRSPWSVGAHLVVAQSRREDGSARGSGKFAQSMLWRTMLGNLRRIGPRKTNGYFFARN